MNSDSGVQFVAARPRKRRRRELSTTPHGQPWRPNGESSNPTPRASLPPLRYPGDGLDFRRPVASPALDEGVIDLTNEPDSPEFTRQENPQGRNVGSRRPRQSQFGGERIADVVDLEEEEPDPPSSPEVQFLSANVRPPRPPPPRPQGLISSNFWRMLQLPHTGLMASAPLPGDDAYGRHVPWRTPAFTPADLETLWIGEGPAGAIDLTINLDMDYLSGLTPERGRPGSSYKPPSPPPEGFTRSVGDDDIAVCPNCDAELGVGDDRKQQIWVAKQCGHVYCGECATNRSLTKAKKTTTRTKPFAKCQVPECGKPISAPRSMFQIYL